MAVTMPPGFEARAVLGKGAMGIVYKCWQPKLKRFVAIKTCNISESVDAGQDPARLEDEALTIARLNHPNIVSLIDVFSDDKNIYLIMEYLEGPPISRFLNRKADPQKLGPLVDMLDLSFSRVFKDDAACQIGISVSRALEYAHSRKVLHRDVKPANIVMTLDRHVKLLDFSIARDPQQEKEGRTLTGTVFGTVQYMSPEQILSNPLDGRTDVYALGCSLYHMVSGEVPFSDNNDINVCLCHVNETPPDILSLNPLIHPVLVDVILKCMEKKPEDRYANSAELADALEEALAVITKGASVAVGAGEEYNISIMPHSQGAAADPGDYSPVEEALPEEPPVSPAAQEPPPPAPPKPAPTPPRQPVFEPVPEAEESSDQEPSDTRERRRRDLREIAAASETGVPTMAKAPETPRRDGRGGGGAAAPWMESARSYTPSAPPDTSQSDPTPVPLARGGGPGKPVLLLVAGAVALVTVIVVLVLVFGKKGEDASSSIERPESLEVAAVRTPAPVSRPEAPPTPTPTPVPTPPPTATPAERAPALPVPAPPEVDPDIKSFRVPLTDELELALVEVPTGTYLMGSPPDEAGRSEDEGPRTKVTFTVPFFVSKGEITRAAWREVMGSAPGESADDLPVTNITWEEAVDFCRRLSDRTGISFSLPSEAQWEYACRATASGPFAFGEIVTSELGNIDGTIDHPRTPRSGFRGNAVPATHMPPNRWGLYNVHGNVWEFTLDSYMPRLAGADQVDPGPASAGVGVVLRGGGFRSGPAEARAAERRRVSKSERNEDVGFRIVAEL